MKTILIVDLEATCWDDKARIPQTVHNTEIIEFGLVVYQQPNIIQSMSVLVKPLDKLTKFCTTLTGITDDMVSSATSYAGAIILINRFLYCCPEIDAWGSWGAYDKNMLKAQNKITGNIPQFAANLPHINIKNKWQKHNGKRKPAGMKPVLNYLNIPLTGSHHRALDDCLNIAKIIPYIDKNIFWEDIL